MKQKRTYYEIFWEILIFCRKPQSFTSIINRCNLNSKIGQKHIEFLKKRNYIVELEHEGMTVLKSTERAGEYTALFTKTYRELFENSPEFRL